MIRAAILGAGIGRQHLAGYRALAPRYHVDVMCDLDLERAANATDHAPDIRITGDVDAVLADPSIDLVDICLPPHLHVPMVLKVLAAGKHAICEKPIARSIPEIEQMQAAMTTSMGHVFPVFQYRYGRGLDQLRALLAAGFGRKAYAASAETHWNRQSAYYGVPWRGTWAGESGGSILGHAIHIHDLLCHILGPVAELSAYLDTRVNAIETEDCAAIAMRMENGALATSSVTLGAATDTTRLRFCFDDFTAESGSAPYTPAEDAWTFTARGAASQTEIDAVVAAQPAPLSGFAGFLDAVADAIDGRPEKAVSFADGRRSIEMVTAMYQSSREGRPVRLPMRKTDSLYEGWIPARA